MFEPGVNTKIKLEKIWYNIYGLCTADICYFDQQCL